MSERRGIGLGSVPWFLWSFVLIGMAWGLLEASFLFMTRYHVVLTERPTSALSLLVAGILAYGVAGLGCGVAMAVAWLVAGLVPSLRRLFAARGPFLATGALLAAPVAYAMFIVKFHPALFRRTPFLHPYVLGSLVAVLVVGALLGIAVYLGLRRVPATALPGRRAVLGAVLGAAGAFLVVGAVAGLVRGGAVETIAPMEVERRPVPADAEALPNIVVITYETLRSDRAAIGEPDTDMPFVSELAAQGVRFTQHFTQAPWTRPSMASLFTSLYPQQHGMNTVTAALGDGVPTLPDELRRRGYHTVYFNTNGSAFDPNYGFDEAYIDYPKLDPYYLSALSVRPFLVAKLYMSFLLDPFQLLLPRDDVNWDWYEDGERVNRLIRAWLEHPPQGPLYIHIHFMDPHHPYYDHPYRRFQVNTRAEWNVGRLLDYYDGEIRFVDRATEDFIAALDDAGLWEGALLVLSSDHGEEFLDHGDWFHAASLHNELVQVPLVLRWPEKLPQGMELEAQARSIDIAPTILALAGIPVPETFEGRSLVPVISGEEIEQREVVSQNLDHLLEIHALRSAGYKYIRYESADGVREELYDVASDPAEHDDVSADYPELTRSMGERVTRFIEHFAASAQEGAERELSDEERERLRALGYVE